MANEISLWCFAISPFFEMSAQIFLTGSIATTLKLQQEKTEDLGGILMCRM